MRTEKDEYCPCCGYSTFNEHERLEYSICPICYWEDDPIQFHKPYYEGGANVVSLAEARLNFEKYGACDESSRVNSRRPLNNERRKVYSKSMFYDDRLIPFWFQTLKQYLSNPLRSGLTIPFLYGVENEMKSPNVGFLDFLIDLVNYHPPEMLTIQKCENIGEFIIGIDKEGAYEQSNFIFKIGNIIILDGSWENVKLSEWVELIAERYYEPIGKELYSKVRGKWQKFTNEDRELIEQTNNNVL